MPPGVDPGDETTRIPPSVVQGARLSGQHLYHWLAIIVTVGNSVEHSPASTRVFEPIVFENPDEPAPVANSQSPGQIT